MSAVKASLVFCALGLLVGVWLIWSGVQDLWLLRPWRCHVSAADADWLADALSEHQCPWCDRELTRH